VKPFTFSADIGEVVTGPDLAARARRAEELGYHALVVPDHLLGRLSPIVAMASVAAATTVLRVSAFVMNNDLRHPAVVAADLASIDVLSGGRLDVAIGAGWNRPEYDAIGLRFDPPPVRRARLAESVAILKQIFAGEPFSFAGEYYTITATNRDHPPSSVRTRRSSSVVAAVAHSRSPDVRPTSSGWHHESRRASPSTLGR
jgi:alkanesulfonate monooxygenase SsuD/methylene tetrahydromethanopterin reductase-like flavin-dependent oxidoreductase (luciferase family)